MDRPPTSAMPWVKGGFIKGKKNTPGSVRLDSFPPHRVIHNSPAHRRSHISVPLDNKNDDKRTSPADQRPGARKRKDHASTWELGASGEPAIRMTSGNPPKKVIELFDDLCLYKRCSLMSNFLHDNRRQLHARHSYRW
jgi:hypothetical protein